jgi:hypothetical protein
MRRAALILLLSACFLMQPITIANEANVGAMQDSRTFASLNRQDLRGKLCSAEIAFEQRFTAKESSLNRQPGHL